MASLQKYDSGGRKYWRIVESFRDPKNGRPKIRVVKHIGTVANLLALLEGQERQLEVCSTSHGDVFSLLRVAGQLGVASAIDDALLPHYQAGVPTLGGLTPGQACVLIAIGRACHPTSKMGWADWAQSTSLPELQHLPVNKLTSQFFWEQMDRIPTTVLPVIEEKLATRALELHTDPLGHRWGERTGRTLRVRLAPFLVRAGVPFDMESRRLDGPRPITPVVPHAHFVRGPTPVTVLVGEASYMKAAPGNGLTAVPAARETLSGVARAVQLTLRGMGGQI